MSFNICVSITINFRLINGASGKRLVHLSKIPSSIFKKVRESIAHRVRLNHFTIRVYGFA